MLWQALQHNVYQKAFQYISQCFTKLMEKDEAVLSAWHQSVQPAVQQLPAQLAGQRAALTGN